MKKLFNNKLILKKIKKKMTKLSKFNMSLIIRFKINNNLQKKKRLKFNYYRMKKIP